MTIFSIRSIAQNKMEACTFQNKYINEEWRKEINENIASS